MKGIRERGSMDDAHLTEPDELIPESDAFGASDAAITTGQLYPVNAQDDDTEEEIVAADAASTAVAAAPAPGNR